MHRIKTDGLAWLLLCLVSGIMAPEIAARVKDDRLHFFTECAPGEKCKPFTVDGQEVSFRSEPALSMGRGEIQEANVVESPGGEKSLRLELAGVPAFQFEALTGKNLGKRIAMVLGETLLVAPLVQQQISGGIVSFDMRAGEAPFWEGTPWLTGLIEKREVAGEPERVDSTNNYMTIGALLLIAAFAYFFLPRSKEA